MATKKENKKNAEKAPKKGAAAAAAPAAKKGKMTPEEKAAKRKARMEALKNRPAGQRPNSKQVDIIDLGNGSKVMNFGAPVRKVGTLVTSVAINADGEVTSTSVTLIPNVTVKAKKGHGTFKYGAPGLGKGKGSDAEEEEEADDDEEDED